MHLVTTAGEREGREGERGGDGLHGLWYNIVIDENVICWPYLPATKDTDWSDLGSGSALDKKSEFLLRMW